jgi:uncharacterized protein YbjT (DUF2867 family)
MILITGASGHVGRRTAELLAQKGRALRLMVRDAKRAPKLSNSEIVEADYANSESLDKAFSGVDTAFVVSGHAEPGERAKLHKNAFDAAARNGVGHVVYLSFQGASPDSKFPFGRDHHQSEQYLRASGMLFSALRDNLYLDMVLELFNEDGVIRAPAGQGAAAYVAREDVAQVTAAVLSNPPDSSAVYDVTGPEALTLAEAAKRLSALVGRELRYENESVEESRKWRSKFDAPAWEVETWLGSYLAIAAGELAAVSDTVLRFTGRQPLSLESYFADRPYLLANLRR